MTIASSNPPPHPSKLRTGAGRITKPGKPTRKQYLDYDPAQNARRQRLAPKLRVMFVQFLLNRLETQGIAVEGLGRAELREHIAAMSDNFLNIAANLERDERDVDDLADVFGQIVAPSGADVVDMIDMLDSTSLLGGATTAMDHDRDSGDISVVSESTEYADGFGDDSTTRQPLPVDHAPEEDDFDDGIE